MATVVLGVVVGGAIGAGGRAGNLRNSLFRILIAIFLAALTLYLLWFMKLGILTKDWDPDPETMWNKIRAINIVGTWSLRGTVANGIILALIWVLEAVIILWGIIGLTIGAGREIFCESCQKWLEATNWFPLTPVTDTKGFKKQLEQGDFSQLENLQPNEDASQGATRVTMTCCSDCNAMAFVYVESIEYKLAKGKTEEKSSKLVENLSISAVRAKSLIEKWAGAQAVEED